VYAIAALAIYSVASAPLTTYLQAWWPTARPPSFLPLYAGIMAVVGAAGLAVLELPTVTDGSAAALAASVPVGRAAGALAIWSDDMVRRLEQRRARQRRLRGDGPLGSARAAPLTPSAFALPAYGRRAPYDAPLALLVAIAVLEELLFRGIAVDLAAGTSSPVLAGAALAMSVVMFAFSHMYAGWIEVLAKLPLGALALLAVLGLETIAPAVVAHVLFNVRAWHVARGARR
jgi:hypothetical protein